MIGENSYHGEPQRRRDGAHGRQRSGVSVGGTPWFLWCKHAFEFVLTLGMLVVGGPIMMVAAIAVKLTSRGPVLYSQTRVGKHGKPFTIFKIRTMINNSEALTGARWCMPGDPRITPVGWFLRRTHIDELPQLWNVLRGEMSLVGPRPERPEFVPRLEETIANYSDRLLIKPGLTGLAQVQLPPDTDLASVQRKLAYDLHYVQNLSFWLEARIYVATALHLVAIPFRVIRRLCALPHGEHIEAAYHQLRMRTPRTRDAAEQQLVSRA
jgi:lipopolysaccharide/colanic/teichoic acid biosynthesis glycosyltransferase